MMLAECVPDEFVWHAVEGLLQIEEGDVEGSVLLAVLLEQKSGHVNRVGGAASFDESGLVDTDVGDVADPLIENALVDLHRVRQEANRPVVGAIGQ